MDHIFERFLDTQHDAAPSLSDSSDLVLIEPLDRERFIISYSCKGYIRSQSGDVIEHEHFAVGVRFPHDYLRIVRPPEVLTWLGPAECWHPNLHPPFICIGKIAPCTPLVELVYRCFDLITYASVTMDEHDALNHAACTWARKHRDRFPVDVRPLKRRSQPEAAGSR